MADLVILDAQRAPVYIIELTDEVLDALARAIASGNRGARQGRIVTQEEQRDLEDVAPGGR